MERLSIGALNAMEKEEFVGHVGGVYEHSAWVADRVAEQRPFQDRAQLISAMRLVVETATDWRKLELIRAHPDLAGKLARAGGLGVESAREQAGLGLDRLSDDEFERFTDLNTRYRERFGFPFVICVRLTDKPGILQSFEARLEHGEREEIGEALRQIHRIARLRLGDAVEE
jgi:2-oxo-4-hydroxy-4-carboxy-5-ureidoimidazoline decarboxylase